MLARTIALAAVVAFAPMAAGPAFAAAPPATTMEADVVAVSDFNARHQQVITDGAALIALTVQGMQQAMAYGLSPSSKREAEAWGERWEADVRTRLVHLKAWKSRMPPLPRAAIQRQGPTLMPMYERMPARLDTTVAAIATFIESTLEPTRKAALGDQAATKLVASEYFRGAGLVLRAENDLMSLSVDGLPDGNPGKSLSLSMLASNEGLGVYLDYMASVSRAQEIDRPAQAAEIRLRADRATAAAKAVSGDVTATKKIIASMKMPNEARYMQAMDTYNESAAVELEVAEMIRALAVVVEKGVITTDEASQRLGGVQALVQRRLAIHNRRLSLLQGQ